MTKLTSILLLLSSFLFFRHCAEQDLKTKAAQIHQDVLTLDSHTDTPLVLMRSDFDLSVLHTPEQSEGSRLDFPRMIEGGLDAVFFAVFIGQGERTIEGNKAAGDKAFAIFNKIHQEVSARNQVARIALNSADAQLLENEGKRSIYLGIENGYAIGRDISLLKDYYQLGARYVTLCHTSNNDICDSSTDDEGPEHDGLSAFGEKVVAEMNRLGMMIDVSHVSDASVEDVLQSSKAPVIASHSCAKALCDNPRNLTDDLIKKIAQKNGVIQVCLLSDYLKKIEQAPERTEAIKKIRAQYKDYAQMSSEEKDSLRAKRIEINAKYPQELATVSDLVDHIDHIVKIAGINHVGIGSDFDGGGKIDGCKDVSEMGNITLELVKRGYTKEQIEKIWSGNLLRVFNEVEQAAEGLTKS